MVSLRYIEAILEACEKELLFVGKFSSPTVTMKVMPFSTLCLHLSLIRRLASRNSIPVAKLNYVQS